MPPGGLCLGSFVFGLGHGVSNLSAEELEVATSSPLYGKYAERGLPFSAELLKSLFRMWLLAPLMLLTRLLLLLGISPNKGVDGDGISLPPASVSTVDPYMGSWMESDDEG